ncbi:haloacid dehalogenase type II [Achromobacter sp. UMC46]|uniref:haloacid dehalogenase type II n=1 Tax=Achromobacter sp. UMC46 TaxID=1862319 RepID=UPI00160361F2|nr:haloacid dehalogenase type II [Achromobacter sp. UMC46]MBB1593414.1 haloacid dehalogenase, type II [Achromobacter sp. UMC46]
MSDTKAVVFDLYGTLYDVHSVVQRCDASYPGRGMEISAMWRQKQLEYTWLRSLMGRYVSFEQATHDALVYVCNHLKLDLDKTTCSELCDAYLQLSPYPEVPEALQRLNSAGLPLAILSNGSVFSIDSVVKSSGLHEKFAHLLSVEAVGVFKPHPRVYALACQALGVLPHEILFVSSNAWDISGARHFGFQTCWVNRSDNTFDELGATPQAVIGGLDELPALINARGV